MANLLVDQVEFADVILMKKTDLVDEAHARKVEGVVRALNPVARAIRTQRAAAPLAEVLDTGLFD